MTVAKDIFHFLNNHYVMCNSRFVNEYVQKSISEIDVIVLAGLIRDLDRETGKKNFFSFIILMSCFRSIINLLYYAELMIFIII